MTASPELQHQLEKLDSERDTYRYIGTAIAEKTLTVLIAPSAVGKSTIISEILRLCSEQHINAGEVGSITTRHRRQDSDPTNYRTADEGVSHAWMIKQIQRYNLINWSLFPTGDVYGTDTSSFPASYNFLPLIPSSLPMLQRAGFSALHAVYITAPIDEWVTRLDERRHDPKFAGRMNEAVQSLEFAKQNFDHLDIVCNATTIVDGYVRPTVIAQHIIDKTLGISSASLTAPGASDVVDDMLRYARTASGQSA